MTGLHAFQQLRPCVDAKGHKFIVSRPPAGDYGYALVLCERCGKERKDLS